MDSLYLLIPFSAFLVLGLLALFNWAVNSGQFEDLDREGERILNDGCDPVDTDQTPRGTETEE